MLRADTNGTSTAINTYDEYGIPGGANVGAFQYTGQVWLPELGLYYYKARMYSPTLGRFMQTDPIGYEDAFNLYGYVGNDPVNGVDPSGLCERTTGSIVCKNGSSSGASDHTYRNSMAAAGAAAGVVVGAAAGGAAGGTGGAVAGAACGPGVVACAPAGGVAGGVLGGLVGDVIDKGIALFNDDADSTGPRGELSQHAQDRMAQQNISPQRVAEAERVGRVKLGNDSKTLVRELPSAASDSGRGIRVVIDRATGRIVTVTDKGSKFR